MPAPSKPLKPRLLNRKERKAIKENSGVDLHKLMLEIIGGVGEGKDVTTGDLMQTMTPDVIDAVVDAAFPDDQGKLDALSHTALLTLATEIISLSFGGDTEKKS